MADENEVVVPAVEEPETPDTPETPEAPELTPEQMTDLRKKADAFEDQRKRAEKAEAELKKLKPSKPESGDDERYSSLQRELSETRERAIRADLRAMGVTHSDDIKLIMAAAKELGIDPTEAAERKYVKAELETQREERRTKEATPPPRGGGGAKSDNIDALANKVEKGERLPTDPELRTKVQEELRKRARNRR